MSVIGSDFTFCRDIQISSTLGQPPQRSVIFPESLNRETLNGINIFSWALNWNCKNVLLRSSQQINIYFWIEFC